MKHFEELWEETGGGICGKQACKKYYQEALKWVIHEMNIIYAGDMAIHTLGPIIKKELLGEKHEN